MSNIREFRNADLPALVDVWIAHWSRSGPPPEVSVAIIEQAVLSRTFFPESTLLVAQQGESVQAWCHVFPDPLDGQAALISAFCFSDSAADLSDPLLQAAESAIAGSGRTQIFVGTVRDQLFGYAGLPPIGHGIGIHDEDLATISLLESHGYRRKSTVQQLVVSTSSFRMPVSRQALHLSRSTGIVRSSVVVSDSRRASALSHFDIERQTLVDRRSTDELATIEIWFSDPEAQVMKSSHAIVDLSDSEKSKVLSPQEHYLLGAVLQSLAAKRIMSVETAVDSDQIALIDQLSKLQFQSQQQGACWQKELSDCSSPRL